MRYFKNFSTIDYDMDGDGKTRKITDVFRKVKIDPKFLDIREGVVHSLKPLTSRPYKIVNWPNHFWDKFLSSSQLSIKL